MSRRLKAFVIGLVVGVLATLFFMDRVHAANQSYTTDWIANTYGTNAAHVGNAARALWVDPAATGTVYTASMWDENGSSITKYVNGQVTQGIGAHGEAQGRTITGNATNLWAARQFSTTLGNGTVIRYVRATGVSDQVLNVSADTTERHADVITGLATWGQYLAASDHPGNRVRLYKTDGTFINDIALTDPGAIAFDRNGNLWVAQEDEGVIAHVARDGTVIGTLAMPAGGRPHALWFEPSTQNLWVGDAGPDQNIKTYSAAGVLVSTFGVQGGYLNTTTGVKGQVGSLRFARIDGIGKDAGGNLYVLSQPWGGSWDNGRTGGTDLYVYSPTGALAYTLRALNFEAIAAPDPATDATVFYSGVNVYSGTGGADWSFVANTVDPFAYPSDLRLNSTTYQGRGLHFGMIANVGGNRILMATDQNPDNFSVYHFDPAQGYTAVPMGWISNVLGIASTHIRKGFALDSNGGVWASFDRNTCSTICYWPLTGFAVDGTPQWGAPQSWAIPSTIGTLGRLIYLPESDTLILANIVGTDWTSLGTRVEVYHGWLAGNQSTPVVITLNSANPKAMAAAGNYLFVGYVHTVPNIDAFNLTTGTLDNTFINSNPNGVYVGNDVDSMYGVRAVLRTNGEYVVTKDNYNGSNVVIYRWVP